jgi:hypothetical protein
MISVLFIFVSCGAALAQDSLYIYRLGQLGMSDYANCVAIADTIAYVGEGLDDGSSGALRIVNISDPASPQQIGSLVTPQAVRGVAVAGNYAYLAEHTAGLRIIDISNPAVPNPIGFLSIGSTAQGVALAGNYAYVANGVLGLLDINISNPAAPALVGTCNTPNSAYDVAISGTYAYVADYDSGLQIINIANPAAPTIVGSYDIQGTAMGVAVSGDYAYVADLYYGLRVINVANPAAPVLAGSRSTPGEAFGVAISGHYAFVADVFNGIRVINFTNPSDLIETGFYDTPGIAFGVAVAGNNIAYVADRDYLGIYDCASAAPIGISLNPFRMSFGNVPVGHDSVQLLTIQNTGISDLTVTGITAPTGFSHHFPLPFTVAVGDSLTDSVQFSPASEQQYNDHFVITSSAPTSSINLLVTGEGIGSSPGIAFSPANVSFGTVQVGHDSTRLFTVRNTGEGTLTVFSLTAPTGYAALFSLPFTVAGGDSLTDTVRFHPTQERHYGGNLIIVSNAPGSPSFVPLSGNGGIPAIDTSPTVLAFGSVDVGQDSVQRLTIRNSGTFPLTVSDAAVPAGFTTSLPLPITMAVGDSVADSVRFSPTAEQVYSGDLVITSDSPSSPSTIPVSGTGVIPSFSGHTASDIPADYFLGPNFPNPFNPTTTIRFGLPRSSLVQIQICDLQGRLVESLASRVFEAGTHTLNYDASAHASGMYVVRMTSETFSSAQKLILLK